MPAGVDQHTHPASNGDAIDASDEGVRLYISDLYCVVIARNPSISDHDGIATGREVEPCTEPYGRVVGPGGVVAERRIPNGGVVGPGGIVDEPKPPTGGVGGPGGGGEGPRAPTAGGCGARWCC